MKVHNMSRYENIVHGGCVMFCKQMDVMFRNGKDERKKAQATDSYMEVML